MVATPYPVSMTGNMDKGQVDTAMKANGYAAIGNWVGEMTDKFANYKLMNRMFDLQTEQMNKYYGLQGDLIGLNKTLITSQEKVASQQITATKEIAELQKERDIAVARTRADAAVKIAKVNALNAQFYGQPNQLPSISA